MNEQNIIKDQVRKDLYQFRSNMTQIQHFKHEYQVFNNETIDQIANQLPRNEKDLLQIKGIGTITFNKYGKDILNIIKKAFHDDTTTVVHTLPGKLANHNKSWTKVDKNTLRSLVHEGNSNKVIAFKLGRSEMAIECEIDALSLIHEF